jgi:hypothetical protein
MTLRMCELTWTRVILGGKGGGVYKRAQRRANLGLGCQSPESNVVESLSEELLHFNVQLVVQGHVRSWWCPAHALLIAASSSS